MNRHPLLAAPPRAEPQTPSPDAGDVALARRVALGDERAFERLFERYREPLHRYCWSITGCPQDADEALQTTMLNAHRALSRARGPAALRPWLYRIAHNASLNLVRDRPSWAPLEADVPDPGDGPFEASHARERMRRLRDDLATLAEGPRTALLLRELVGMSHREIAGALGEGADAATAKRLIFEAREALHDMASGREQPCREVRITISDGDGRVMRSRRVRSHLRSCETCAAFRASIHSRGGDLAALAVLPALGAVRMVAGTGGSSASGLAATGVVGGGSAAGGVAGAVTAGGLGAKIAAVVTVAAIGGAAAVLPATISSGTTAPPGPAATQARVTPEALRFGASPPADLALAAAAAAALPALTPEGRGPGLGAAAAPVAVAVAAPAVGVAAPPAPPQQATPPPAAPPAAVPPPPAAPPPVAASPRPAAPPPAAPPPVAASPPPVAASPRPAAPPPAAPPPGAAPGRRPFDAPTRGAGRAPSGAPGPPGSAGRPATPGPPAATGPGRAGASGGPAPAAVAPPGAGPQTGRPEAPAAAAGARRGGADGPQAGPPDARPAAGRPGAGSPPGATPARP